MDESPDLVATLAWIPSAHQARLHREFDRRTCILRRLPTRRKVRCGAPASHPV